MFVPLIRYDVTMEKNNWMPFYKLMRSHEVFEPISQPLPVHWVGLTKTCKSTRTAFASELGAQGHSDGGSISKVGGPKTNGQIFFRLQPGPAVA